jgi:3-oxoacyl-[acyl-carrier protein] reductase
MDVSRISDVEAAVAECTRQLGSPDIVINNAGVLHSTPVLQITESEWDHILDVNLKGAFFVAQKTLPHMIERRWGRIVNISSVAGRMGGYANGLAYSASKAGLIGLSHGLARRVAEHNVTVNAVAPGTTESEIIKQFTEDQKNALRSIIPLGRLGRVDDIAALVLFLSSDLASFITGAIIDINGGMYSG